MWVGGKGKPDGSRDTQEPSLSFLKGTAFEPLRWVILVYTPTAGDGPGCGPVDVSSQTRCVWFVGRCQELHCHFYVLNQDECECGETL